MKKKRMTLYYFLWAVLGVLFITIDVFLSIERPGAGVFIELTFAMIVYWFSLRKKSLGWLIVIVSSLAELVAYNFYCSRWSAVVCNRNLLIISAGPIFMFGILWLAHQLGLLITKISKTKKF